MLAPLHWREWYNILAIGGGGTTSRGFLRKSKFKKEGKYTKY
jgi:hypothetical protein